MPPFMRQANEADEKRNPVRRWRAPSGQKKQGKTNCIEVPEAMAPKHQSRTCDNLVEAVLEELVAQLVEHRPFKALVLGSSPSELTTFFRPQNPSKIESSYSAEACVGRAPGATGSVKWKVAPEPSSLSAQMRPLWARTICLAMASPRPVPPDSRERALSTR